LDRLQKFKYDKNELILHTMIEYMSLEVEHEADFDCGYTQNEIDECGKILDDYIDSLIALNGNTEKIMSCIKDVVLNLNELNKKAKYSLIETDQREVLVPFIEAIAIEAGLSQPSDDITYEWREW